MFIKNYLDELNISNNFSKHIIASRKYWPIAQMAERLTVNQDVTGSIPVGSARIKAQR